MDTTATHYGPVAKTFHWLIFALLVAQYTIGSIMPHIGRNTPDQGWVSWHLSVGATILLVIVLRFLWRLRHPVPIPASIAPWERRLAYFIHWMLYLLVFAMTMLGWAAANSRGWQVKVLGIIPLPALAPKGASWAHEAGDIHNVLVYVLLGFIVLHVAGALFHALVHRDEILRRMLPVQGNA
jgi:cytochrome b561